MKRKSTFSIIEIIFIIVITGIVTSLTTGVILFSGESSSHIDPVLNDFIKAYESVKSAYYEEVDSEAMIESAIDGMMDYLGDNYSIYMDEDEAENLADELSGEYEGLGIEITETNIVNTVFENTPAESAGILVGDKILKVNNIEVYNSSETINQIAQKEDITLEIQRGEEIINISAKRETIDKPIVQSEVITVENKNIGYIYVSSFTKNVGEQFKEEIGKLELAGIESLIIDVRYNSGGYLDQAVELSSIFLEKGETIYTLTNKDGSEVEKDKTDESKSYPIVVLQNGASASASEILAGALKDSYGATIIGTTSYGKGKVQQTSSVGGDALIKYTTSEWLRPNGENVEGIGIVPDIEVEQTIKDDVIIDTQLETALNYLIK